MIRVNLLATHRARIDKGAKLRRKVSSGMGTMLRRTGKGAAIAAALLLVVAATPFVVSLVYKLAVHGIDAGWKLGDVGWVQTTVMVLAGAGVVIGLLLGASAILRRCGPRMRARMAGALIGVGLFWLFSSHWGDARFQTAAYILIGIALVATLVAATVSIRSRYGTRIATAMQSPRWRQYRKHGFVPVAIAIIGISLFLVSNFLFKFSLLIIAEFAGIVLTGALIVRVYGRLQGVRVHSFRFGLQGILAHVRGDNNVRWLILGIMTMLTFFIALEHFGDPLIPAAIDEITSADSKSGGAINFFLNADDPPDPKAELAEKNAFRAAHGLPLLKDPEPKKDPVDRSWFFWIALWVLATSWGVYTFFAFSDEVKHFFEKIWDHYSAKQRSRPQQAGQPAPQKPQGLPAWLQFLIADVGVDVLWAAFKDAFGYWRQHRNTGGFKWQPTQPTI